MLYYIGLGIFCWLSASCFSFAWHLMHHFPPLATRNWRSDWDRFPWIGDGPAAESWRRGQTGVELVDAAMRGLHDYRKLQAGFAQPRQHGPSGSEQPVFARGRCELRQPRTEHETPLQVSADETMMFKSNCQAMGGGAGQSGRSDETGQRRRPPLESGQYQGRFVQYAHTA